MAVHGRGVVGVIGKDAHHRADGQPLERQRPVGSDPPVLGVELRDPEPRRDGLQVLVEDDTEALIAAFDPLGSAV